MANTRFITSAANLALSASIKNGTGGSAPSLYEATGYPMTNALQHDRYTPWQVSSGAGTPVPFDIDLGANYSIVVVGLHGFRLLSGSMGDLEISYTTAATGYVPASFTLLTTITAATLNASGARDACKVVSATTARYLRFSFAHTTAVWTVGKLLAAVEPAINAGMIYDIGGVESTYRSQLVTSSPSGHPLVEDLGDQGNGWQIAFGNVSTSLKDTIRGLGQQSRPFSLVDENDALYEARLASGGLSCSRVFNDLWNVSIELTRLP